MSVQAMAQIETGAIYFVTLALETDVHVMGGLGFTNLLHLFCWGEAAAAAEETAKAYLFGAGVVVKKVLGSTTAAAKQDPATYTFPEQIYGLPDRIAVQAIRSKGFPDFMVEDTLQALRKRQNQLRMVRQLRAAQKG
jgi:hypothetical protein